MSGQALFVDLPNFYSRLLKSEIGDERELRDYFLYWFDFDRLSEALTGEFSPVWVFYSGQRFGPSENRIHGEYLEKFILRINSLKGVTARDVNIPGQQREPASYTCDNCNHSGTAEWESEKGIDASLTVHLFDTMDTWEAAHLLSGDADFVPVVASLRKRGKILIGAGFKDPSSALVRECYDYIDLSEAFIRDDFVAYQIFKKGGLLENWLTHDVRVQPGDEANTEPIELSFEWQQSGNDHLMKIVRLNNMTDVLLQKSPHYSLFLLYHGPLDPTERMTRFTDFKSKYPEFIDEADSLGRPRKLILSPIAWQGVRRRFEQIVESYETLQDWEGRQEGRGFSLHYQRNNDTGQYEIYEPNE